MSFLKKKKKSYISCIKTKVAIKFIKKKLFFSVYVCVCGGGGGGGRQKICLALKGLM